MEVQGKVALVTGAGVRVGRRIALALARRGMDVAIHYNSSQGPAEETAAAARETGVRAELFQA
ncbi:MAG: SDR family NAD(P)-dependent oxidoreductase, partial [Gemmatimonadota bacterium]